MFKTTDFTARQPDDTQQFLGLPADMKTLLALRGLKQCNKCKEAKTASEFHKKAAAKDGLQPQCKECKAATAKARNSTPEFKVKKAAYDKARNSTPSVKARRAATNKARNSTPEARVMKVASDANMAARKYGNDQRVTGDDILNAREEANHQCIYCGSTERLSVEHIVPLALGGSNAPENITVACFLCNSRKSSTPLLVWFSKTIKSLGGVNLSTGEQK